MVSNGFITGKRQKENTNALQINCKLGVRKTFWVARL